MPARLFIYCSAYEQKSYGIRILYTLAAEISRLGREARCLCFSPRPAFRLPSELEAITQYLDEGEKPDISDEDIVVYSDSEKGNPLGAKRVVRYLLNKPGVLTGALVDYGPSDYIVEYSPLVGIHFPKLFLLNDDRELIDRWAGSRREDSVAFYFGKIEKKNRSKFWRIIARVRKDFSGHYLITRRYPRDRDELFSILSKVSLLVSLDPLTNLNYEAALLGTPVLLLNDSYNTEGTEFAEGIFFEYDGKRFIPRSGVDVASFRRKLESQGAAVSSFLADAEEHFTKIETSIEASHEHARKVRQKVEADMMELGAGRKFANCTNIDDVPLLDRMAIERFPSSDMRKTFAFFPEFWRLARKKLRRRVVNSLKRWPEIFETLCLIKRTIIGGPRGDVS